MAKIQTVERAPRRRRGRCFRARGRRAAAHACRGAGNAGAGRWPPPPSSATACGHAARERELIRQSGLLRLSVPTAHGGAGASWSTVLGAARRLAQADSALAHVFGFHHLQAGCCSTARPSSTPISWNRPWRATCSGAMRSIRWTAASRRARRAGRLSHRRRQELQLGFGGLGPADLLGLAQAVRHGADRRAADARRGHHRQPGLGRLRPAPDR